MLDVHAAACGIHAIDDTVGEMAGLRSSRCLARVNFGGCRWGLRKPANRSGQVAFCVDQEIRRCNNLFAFLDTIKHFDKRIAATAKLHGPRFKAALTLSLIHI